MERGIVRYNYRCSKCKGSVSKPPVAMDKNGKMTAGLHGWKCPKDGPVSVTRTLEKSE